MTSAEREAEDADDEPPSISSVRPDDAHEVAVRTPPSGR